MTTIMTDITTIANEAPTYSELADIAGELAARVQELEAATGAMLPLFEDWTEQHGPCDHSVGICICEDIAIAERVRRAIGEGRP